MHATHRHHAIALMLAAGLLLPCFAPAQTSVWNGTISGTFSNPASWVSGGVPGADSTALWTNHSGSVFYVDLTGVTTNANALVASPRATSLQGPTFTNSTYWVTNIFTIGSIAGSTGFVQSLPGSTLAVTNASGTAQLYLGGPGVGAITMNGGSIYADNFTFGNAVTSTVQSAILRFQKGSLTTLRGSTLVVASNVTGGFLVANTAGGAASWNMLGGTNLATMAGASGNKRFQIASTSAATGSVVVSGAGTLWSNVTADTGYVDLYVGANSAANGSLTVSNGAKVWFGGGLYMQGTNAQVLVTDGGQVNASGNNGASMTSVGGSLVVSNPGSRVVFNSHQLGQGGASNRWVVANGGEIAISGNSLAVGGGTNGFGNSITVVGTNSRLTSSGNIWIDAGGGTFGTSLGTTGAGQSNFVVVADGGRISATNTADIYVGAFGSGARLLVTNGGALSARTVYLGFSTNTASGSLLVDGAGSMVSVGQLSVGTNTWSNGGVNKGSGRALIQNGGTVEVTTWGLYAGVGGAGTISNLGGVFQFAVANPAISNYGQASIVVQDGTVAFRNVAAAEVLGNITNLAYSGANTLRLTAATNAALASYAFSNGATFASLDLQSNSLFRSASLFLGTGGKLSGNGVLGSTTVTNAGTISPGNSPGSLTFSNNLTLLGTSTLVLELAGTNSNLYDFLDIRGTLAKAGTVLVTNLGYTFLGGEVFDFIDAGAMAGSFGSLELPVLSGGMTWDTSLFESAGILSIAAIPEPSAALLLFLGSLAAAAVARPRRSPPAG